MLGRVSAVRAARWLLVLAAAASPVPSALAAEAGAARTIPAEIAPSAETVRFYFFSPDWRPPDLGQLAVAMTAALSSRGVHASFQAFTRYEDFERQAIERPPLFMIAPSWIQNLSPSLLGQKLTVLASPERSGSRTYRKALLVRAKVDSIDDLARGSIAATVHTMGPGTSEPILSAFHLGPDSARVVPVPKDVDALLALRFGQVDAALTTGHQYEILAASHPAEAETLRVLAFSQEVPLPPLFARDDAPPALREEFESLFAELGQAPNGRELLAMLGFDRFTLIARPDERSTGGGALPQSQKQPERRVGSEDR